MRKNAAAGLALLFLLCTVRLAGFGIHLVVYKPTLDPLFSIGLGGPSQLPVQPSDNSIAFGLQAPIDIPPVEQGPDQGVGDPPTPTNPAASAPAPVTPFEADPSTVVARDDTANVPTPKDSSVTPPGSAPSFTEAAPSPVALRSKRSDRVYCMVPFVWIDAKMQRYKEIMNTWGPKCDILRFFVDKVNEGVQLPDNVIEIISKRPSDCDGKPCRHIWEKVWRMTIWVGTNDIQKADWFYKVDDDAYFFPGFARKFVAERNWNPDDHHYFGHRLHHEVTARGVTIIAGATVGYSRKSLRVLVPIYKEMPSKQHGEDGTCADFPSQDEEITTAICLKNFHNVSAEATHDDRGGEYIMLFHPHAHLGMIRSAENEDGWFWKNKPTVGHGATCCAFHPIAFHGYKDDGELARVYSQLFNSGSFDNLDDNAKGYFTRIRKELQTLSFV